LKANKKEKFGKPSYMVVDEIREILEGAIASYEKCAPTRGAT
jgi:hypothetical protein